MQHWRLLAIIYWALLLSLSAFGQETGYLDLTDNAFRGSSRHARMGGGICAGSPHASLKPGPRITVTLLSLDKTRYQPGEEVTFEVRVLNTGIRPLPIPWTPHLGDIEPPYPNTAYTFRMAEIELSFRDLEGNVFSLGENLYGIRDVPDSFRELAPGEWFLVRGRKRIDMYQNWGKKQFADLAQASAEVTAHYRQYRGSYSPQNGGSFNYSCIPFPSRSANELEVIIEPR